MIHLFNKSRLWHTHTHIPTISLHSPHSFPFSLRDPSSFKCFLDPSISIINDPLVYSQPCFIGTAQSAGWYLAIRPRLDFFKIKVHFPKADLQSVTSPQCLGIPETSARALHSSHPPLLPTCKQQHEPIRCSYALLSLLFPSSTALSLRCDVIRLIFLSKTICEHPKSGGGGVCAAAISLRLAQIRDISSRGHW